MSGTPRAPREGEQRTLEDGSRSPAGAPPLFVTRVASGPDAGTSLVLDWNAMPRVLVGQSRVCELVVADPRVSRRHLALAPEGHGVRVTDLGSTNGTRIGGVRVFDAVLTGGESLELGDTVLRIVRAGELPASAAAPRDRFGRVLGRSQDMQRLFALCERLAPSALPVLVEGETGTGKELLAEAIHDAGPRAGGPLVVFDCSAHAGEEEIRLLFGDEDGGGAVEQAMGGTLVLDEIGELGAGAQARLVSWQRTHADVRLVSTTRQDLEKRTDEGTFREELLFRIAGARLEIPPLRKRHGDVELLARHFWTLFGGAGELPRTFALMLSRHEWPGNVRELEHAVARRIALGDELEGALVGGRRDGARATGDFLESILGMGLAMPHARQLVIEEFEQRYVERAIAEHGGNVSRAAAASGMTRRYFHMLRAKRRAPR